MTLPSTRLPGLIAIPGNPGGTVNPAAIVEWPDLRPPDDAAPVQIRVDIVGAGPGTIRLGRAPGTGTYPEYVQAVGAVPDPLGYTFVLDYPIVGAWRVSYENNGPDPVVALCQWAYQSPGRR